jgi:hypothetical protein
MLSRSHEHEHPPIGPYQPPDQPIQDGTSSLSADGITVDQSMFCRKKFTATGGVRLTGAHIGGRLSFTGAKLANPRGAALSADGITVDQSMFCRNEFTATGGVRLVGAHIGGQLSFSTATLDGSSRSALVADRLTVNLSMFCTDEFTATGEVRLVGAHIGGQLSFDGATLANLSGVTLNLEAANVSALHLQPKLRPNGPVHLTNARVGTFKDAAASWPEELCLRGFAYDSL